MSKMKIIGGVIVIFVVGFLFAAPYITVFQMKSAAEKHDGEVLSKYIDFPVLRESLKDQMNVMFEKEMPEEEEDNSLSAIRTALVGKIAEKMVDKMVDAFVTPAGITELMMGEKPNSGSESSSSNHDSSSEPFANASMSYESFSKFSVTIKDDESNEETKFILRRRGIGWKLTEIMLPL